MTKYSLTFKNKKYEISGNTYVFLFLAWVFVISSFAWFLFGGIWRFGENYLASGVLSLMAFIFFLPITINNKDYSFLPQNKFVKIMNKIVIFSFVMYYIYLVFIVPLISYVFLIHNFL